MIYFWRNRNELSSSLNTFYQVMGTSKQNFHQRLRREKRRREEIIIMIDLINQIRSNHPTMNSRSMYYLINPMYVGRDKFETICRECGFLIKRAKNYRRTTDSTGVIRFDNLLKNRVISGINQVWSSDITYFEIAGKFYYITFIIDNYSRRIVGHHTSARLQTEQTTLPAFKVAIKTRKNHLPKGLVFHSDGGGQYYDDNFLALTRKHNIANSMCEMPWENGQAERVNGVIKNNYLIHWCIHTPQELIRQVDRAVWLYNYEKPHSQLGNLSPVKFEEKVSILANEKTYNTKKSPHNRVLGTV